MKITNTAQVNYLQNQEAMKVQKEDAVKKEKDAPAAVYEKSKPEEKLFIYDKVSVEQLKKDSEQHYENLKRMVEDLLKRQGMTFNDVRLGSVVKVDEATRAEAAELVSDNGPLGVEAMSDKIVQFAKAISGGDPSKLDTIKKAIDDGFAAAKQILGELPEISQKTYDRIMEKLDIWENE